MRKRLKDSRREVAALAQALRENLSGRIPAADGALAPLTHVDLKRAARDL